MLFIGPGSNSLFVDRFRWRHGVLRGQCSSLEIANDSLVWIELQLDGFGFNFGGGGSPFGGFNDSFPGGGGGGGGF